MPLTPEQKEARAAWKREEKLKREQAKIDEQKRIAAEGDGVYSGPLTAEEVEIQSDWEKLVAEARLKFPEHLALKFNLKPQQRAVAVAFTLGWSQVKIESASKISRKTISKYLQDPVVKEFIEAFNLHTNPKGTGQTNIKSFVEKELYNSVMVMKELRDDPSVSATTRADISKWFYEQVFGKAKETKEVRGVDIKKLTEELNASRNLLGSVELEDETN